MEYPQPSEIVLSSYDIVIDDDRRPATLWRAEVLDQNGRLFDEKEWLTARNVGPSAQRSYWVDSWGPISVRDNDDDQQEKQWVVPEPREPTDQFDILDGFYTEAEAAQVAFDLNEAITPSTSVWSVHYFIEKYDALQSYSWETRRIN